MRDVESVSVKGALYNHHSRSLPSPQTMRTRVCVYCGKENLAQEPVGHEGSVIVTRVTWGWKRKVTRFSFLSMSPHETKRGRQRLCESMEAASGAFAFYRVSSFYPPSFRAGLLTHARTHARTHTHTHTLPGWRLNYSLSILLTVNSFAVSGSVVILSS